MAERQLTSAEQAIRERRANRFQKDYDEDQLGKGSSQSIVLFIAYPTDILTLPHHLTLLTNR